MRCWWSGDFVTVSQGLSSESFVPSSERLQITNGFSDYSKNLNASLRILTGTSWFQEEMADAGSQCHRLSWCHNFDHSSVVKANFSFQSQNQCLIDEMKKSPTNVMWIFISFNKLHSKTVSSQFIKFLSTRFLISVNWISRRLYIQACQMNSHNFWKTQVGQIQTALM